MADTRPIAANAYAALARLGDRRPPMLGRRPQQDAGCGPELRLDAQGRDRCGVSRPAQKSDAQAQAVATGKANMVDVVTAVAETETAVQTLVSVRDKVIAAYEEILKMPI